MEHRQKEKILREEFSGFAYKILKRNGEAEFERATLLTISEKGLTCALPSDFECQVGDLLFGVIESPHFKTRMEAVGKITTKNNEEKTLILEFPEEILVPDILIAQSMAVA